MENRPADTGQPEAFDHIDWEPPEEFDELSEAWDEFKHQVFVTLVMPWLLPLAYKVAWALDRARYRRG